MPERPSPEHFAAAHGSPESKEEAEIDRLSFEYVDAEGKLLGTAEIELAGPEIPVEYKTIKEKEPGRARELRSFVLRGTKDGAATSIDMLELANRSGVKVVTATGRLENYYYSEQDKVAVVPPLETPIDVGVFLHELGHAEQHHEERFEKITPLYGRSKHAASGDIKLSYATMAELLDAVVAAVPDAAKALDTDELMQLRRLEDRRNDQLDRKVKLERALDEQMDHRDHELQDLVDRSLRGRLDLDALDEELKRLSAEEHHVHPPLEASPRLAKLVDRLTDLGIRFAEEAREEGLDAKEWRAEDPHFPSERGDMPERLLSELSITTPELARKVLTSVREMHAYDADLRYDAGTQELVARIPFRRSDVSLSGGITKRSFGQKPEAIVVRIDLPRDEFERYAEQRANADREVLALGERTDQAFADAQKTQEHQQMLIDELDMKDVAALPTRMMERDATRRAFQWLRAVRQRAGIDLLASHHVRRDALVAAAQPVENEDCVTSTAEAVEEGKEPTVEASVVADLKRALTSYGADRAIRPADGDGSGFMPIAGHERPKKP